MRIGSDSLPSPIERAVAAFAGCRASDVVIDRTCAGCGRPHGKPRVLAPVSARGHGLVVSKSSAAGLVAVAVAEGQREIGVDIESVAALSRARVDEVAFSAAERDLIDDEPPSTRPALRTRLWSRKEAFLKATGDGVRLDLATIDLADGTPVEAVIVDVPTRYDSVVLSVAVLGAGPVVVELAGLDPDGVSGEAREGAC